jgi:hypothetical protein
MITSANVNFAIKRIDGKYHLIKTINATNDVGDIYNNSTKETSCGWDDIGFIGWDCVNRTVAHVERLLKARYGERVRVDTNVLIEG